MGFSASSIAFTQSFWAQKRAQFNGKKEDYSRSSQFEEDRQEYFKALKAHNGR